MDATIHIQRNNVFRPLFLWKEDLGRSKSRKPALDGLRGLAVLLVIASHTGFAGLIGLGAAGVWIFFTLSGYLLAQAFLNKPELATSPSLLATFFVRRGLRILPAYWACVLLLYAPQAGNSSGFIYANLGFTEPYMHLWSVKQELILYGLLPFVFLAAFPLRGKPLAMAGFFIVAAIFIHVFMLKNSLVVAFVSKQLYGLPFMLGITVAALERSVEWKRQLTIPTMQLFCDAFVIASLLAAFLTTNENWSRFGLEAFFAAPADYWAWNYYWVYSVGAAMLLACVLMDGRLVNELFGSFILRAIGILGYSMYLTHWFVFTALEKMGVPDGVFQFFLTIGITFALSTAFYGLIERTFWNPFGKDKKNYRNTV